MTVLEAFRMMAAEFGQVPDETVEQWITLAGPLVSKKRFGPLYVQAVALLAAHKMKLAGFGGDGMEGIPVNGCGVWPFQLWDTVPFPAAVLHHADPVSRIGGIAWQG